MRAWSRQKCTDEGLPNLLFDAAAVADVQAWLSIWLHKKPYLRWATWERFDWLHLCTVEAVMHRFVCHQSQMSVHVDINWCGPLRVLEFFWMPDLQRQRVVHSLMFLTLRVMIGAADSVLWVTRSWAPENCGSDKHGSVQQLKEDRMQSVKTVHEERNRELQKYSDPVMGRLRTPDEHTTQHYSHSCCVCVVLQTEASNTQLYWSHIPMWTCRHHTVVPHQKKHVCAFVYI